MSWVGRFWEGGGDHEGHFVTCIEVWKPRHDIREDGTKYVTTGRVRCECGAEWEPGGWPV